MLVLQLCRSTHVGTRPHPAAAAAPLLPLPQDMSPNQYIQWRYATGEDRESLDKVSRKVGTEGGGGRAGKDGRGALRLHGCMLLVPVPARS